MDDSPAVRPRRRKTASERRAQQRRSDARTAQKLMKGLASVSSHRGSNLSTIGSAFRDALAALQARDKRPAKVESLSSILAAFPPPVRAERSEQEDVSVPEPPAKKTKRTPEDDDSAEQHEEQREQQPQEPELPAELPQEPLPSTLPNELPQYESVAAAASAGAMYEAVRMLEDERAMRRAAHPVVSDAWQGIPVDNFDESEFGLRAELDDFLGFTNEDLREVVQESVSIARDQVLRDADAAYWRARARLALNVLQARPS